ncbi:MAG: transporter [Flaviaesturariibacter sp.]|nr:transporter [Flaviaesturariibacter sp.]
MNLLQVSGIGKREGGMPLLTAINLSLKQGERLGLMGETGSGKSTLLRIIGGRAQASTGSVFFEGKEVPGTDQKLLPGHPGIAWLSQQHTLPQHLRIEQVLEYAATADGIDAPGLYALCHIDHLLKRKTHELSGGEQQRVATACLLLGTPRLLLLDEPFSNLDARHRAIMRTLLDEAAKRLNFATILVSHDPLDILPWADHVAILEAGSLAQTGTPAEVYRHPISTHVAGLLGPYDLLPADASGKQCIVRPEDWILNPAEPQLQGVVERIWFMGGYDHIEVSVPWGVVNVQVRSGSVRTGQAVNLSVSDR